MDNISVRGENKDQSNFVKGGIAFARWQHRTDGLAAIARSPLPLGGL